MPSGLENSRIRISLGIGSVLVVVTIIIVSAIFGTAPPKRDFPDSGAIQVIAAENFWGNIASQIGGNRVRVTSIINDPTADPHLYESNAHDAAALASAAIVIENGLGYDDFIDKLLAASPKSNRQVLSVEKILNITDDNANPHAWYDIPKIHSVAEAIETGLIAQAPDSEAYFKNRLHNFNNSLQPILNTIAQIRRNYQGAPVAYTERVPQYLLNAAGLKDKTPSGFAIAIEDGNSPSPADSLAMDNLITEHQVKVLLYNAQATSPVTQHVRDLAKYTGIPIVAITETLPANEPTYQSWQLDQAKALLRALSR